MLSKKHNIETKLFLWMYFICFFSLYLGLINGFPFANLLTKVKFVYIAYGCLFLFRWMKRVNKKVFGIILLLSGYIVSFSTIFKNQLVGEYIEAHFIMMTMYMAMLIITYMGVSQYRCFIPFVGTSFWSIFLFLLIASLRDISSLVWNPLYIAKVMLFDLRVRSDFDIAGTSNYVGAFGFVAFMLSFIYLYALRLQGKKIWKDRSGICILVADCYLFLVFSSASSRTPIVSMMVFLVVFFIICNLKIIKKLWFVFVSFIAIGILGLQSIGFFEYVWRNSNRVLNVTVNAEAFRQVGNFWTGMGFVENGLFNVVSGFPWGVITSSLDMYYVYLFYSTGFIGTLWMGTILLLILWQIIKNRKSQMFPIVLSIYVSLLFYAFWESIIFTYRFWPFIMLFAVFLMFIDGNICNLEYPKKGRNYFK